MFLAQQHREMVFKVGLHSGDPSTHQYPVVQYSQLSGDRPVSHGDGRYDHAADTSQGHRSLQPDGLRRRRAGRLRLEARPRRRISAASQRNAARRLPGLRDPSLLHGPHHPG